VKERLAAGEEFGELAHRYSANIASARHGGLLDPFSAADDEIPAVFRQVAFSLKPGQVSAAVRVGQWHHLIKLDRLLEPQECEFDRVRPELEQSVRDRLSDAAMFGLFEKLFEQATIEINDPMLRAAFNRKHPGRAR
jgi:parvulin-like peptidyl-prolyl isomerase